MKCAWRVSNQPHRTRRPVLDDVELDRDLDVVELRREMERAGAPPAAKAA